MGAILLKRSNVASAVPVSLGYGELAVNVADKKMFIGNGVTVVEMTNQNTTGTAGGLSGKPAIAVSSSTFGTNITNDTITSAAFTALESAGIANREQQKTLKQRLQTGTVTIMQSSGAKADQWTWSTVPFVAVALPYKLDSASYTVLTEVVSFTGSLGVVTVTGKSATGFKIQHNGNANSVVVNWIAVKLSL